MPYYTRLALLDLVVLYTLGRYESFLSLYTGSAVCIVQRNMVKAMAAMLIRQYSALHQELRLRTAEDCRIGQIRPRKSGDRIASL